MSRNEIVIIWGSTITLHPSKKKEKRSVPYYILFNFRRVEGLSSLSYSFHLVVVRATFYLWSKRFFFFFSLSG